MCAAPDFVSSIEWCEPAIYSTVHVQKRKKALRWCPLFLYRVQHMLTFKSASSEYQSVLKKLQRKYITKQNNNKVFSPSSVISM
jgi:hypothetical protein